MSARKSDVPDDVLIDIVKMRQYATNGPFRWSGGGPFSIFAERTPDKDSVLIATVLMRPGALNDAIYMRMAMDLCYALAIEELERRGLPIPPEGR